MSTLPKLFLEIDIQQYQLLLISILTILLIPCCNSSRSSLCGNNGQLMSILSLMHWKMLHIARNKAYLLKDALGNYFKNLRMKYVYFAKGCSVS